MDEADAAAEAKRASRDTLPLLGFAARDADGMSLENVLSESDTVPLVAVGGG